MLQAVNRLQHEKSPYLKQHQSNPVDWYPWCDEAFAEAKRRDIPVFLSIGYSTCHWCHVMERESFEDHEVAALLNQDFIAIKVDREERPDIDQIYMRVCQAMTGHGGWPLTIVMHPDKRPFFSGTYLTKTSKHGRLGLMELLSNVTRVWQSQREELEGAAAEITAAVATEEIAAQRPMSTVLTDRAFETFRQRFDQKCGGFGSKPKFPSFHNLIFLTRYAHIRNNAEALAMVEKTMTEIIAGGISDQVGHGIHRYSTDTDWHLPHFEKMLYDQAMFMLALAEIFQKTQKPVYRAALEHTAQFIARELKNPSGGYSTAYDADSEGEEGKFYVFTYAELLDILSDEELRFLVLHLSVRERGNFFDESTHEPSPANILHWVEKPTGGVSPDWPAAKMFADFEPIRQKIFSAREKRIRPGLDDKVLTDINGLILAALSRAALVTADTQIAEAAAAQFRFIASRITSDGKTFHAENIRGKIPGNLDDYAFAAWGLLEYYQTSRENSALLAAIALTDTTLPEFAAADGGFYFAGKDAADADLIARTREFYDGAIPSGNSAMAANLARLYQLTADTQYREAFEKLMGVFAGIGESLPSGSAHALSAFLSLEAGAELVVAQPSPGFGEFLAQTYHPGLVVVQIGAEISEKISYLKNYAADQETYWLCKNFACELPVHALDTLAQRLSQ